MSINGIPAQVHNLETTDMAIDIRTTNPGHSQDVGSSKRAQKDVSDLSAETVSKPAGGSSDTVTVTSEAERLLKLEGKLADLPEVDSARVEELRQAISDGTFKVDANKIAQILLQLESDLT